ncbi:hypothetical protein D3Z36_13680 [Lachnospiraceae bacterium]|nr:hypothetical protein [Lachnospiraceae bacterium]
MRKYLSACWNLMFLLLLLHMDEYDSGREVLQRQNVEEQKQEEQAVEVQQQDRLYFGSDGYLNKLLSQQEKESLLDAFAIQEHEVYSFLQGPRSWEEGVTWSGEWCAFGVEGNIFGGFGCGLCCMANIYNTLSPYEVSPWDMCEYSMSVSNYAPNWESGAISWRHMREALRSCGVSCGLFHKPQTYEEFQEQMEEMKSAVVLVSSKEDDSYWKDTPGHYVNIWLYQKEDDTVFLAEPGSPENNRSRIPLRYVYDALKTASSYQYLGVKGYQEQNNQWKADGIDEIWNSP